MASARGVLDFIMADPVTDIVRVSLLVTDQSDEGHAAAAGAAGKQCADALEERLKVLVANDAIKPKQKVEAVLGEPRWDLAGEDGATVRVTVQGHLRY